MARNVSSSYCSQVLSKEVDACVTELLKELVRFQDRMYQKDPVKAKTKRRLVLGLREVLKHLKLRKLKCVIISPNCEKIQSKGRGALPSGVAPRQSAVGWAVWWAGPPVLWLEAFVCGAHGPPRASPCGSQACSLPGRSGRPAGLWRQERYVLELGVSLATHTSLVTGRQAVGSCLF